MSLESHLDELRRRHGAIDRAVQSAQSQPGAADTTIAEMKRRRLSLKDSIARIESQARLHS